MPTQVLRRLQVSTSLGRRPSFPMRALADKARLRQFLAVLDWFVEVVLAHI